MGLPKEKKNVDEVERQIRRLVDRGLRDLREDFDEILRQEVAMSANNPAAVTRPRSRLRYVWISLLVLLMVAVGVGGWMVYSGISISLRAETNLHAIRLTIRVVEQFVHDKGRWPRSWEEMEQQRFPSTTPSPLNVGYRESEGWPAVSKHLQEMC